MKIDDIMSTRLVSVGMDDTLATIKEIFDHVKFHHLLVLENNELFGVISDRDYLKAVSPYVGTPAETFRDLQTLNQKAHQIMSRRPVVLHAGDDINDAVKQFNNNSISCLPVVDADFKPIGIVTVHDVLRAIEKILPAKK